MVGTDPFVATKRWLTPRRGTAFASLAFVLAVASPSYAAPGCPVPGFNLAAFGDVSVSVGNGNTDSYDSALGTYAATKCTGAGCIGGVATNGSGSGAVSLGPNASVKGACIIGATGATANITPNASKCNSTSAAGSVITLPVPTLPTVGVTALGAITNSTTIPGAGVYSASSVNLAGQKSLNLAAGPVVIYLTGSGSVLSLSGQAAINNNTQRPTNLVFMCTSNSPQTISVVGNGNAFYAIYCPKADITIAGNGTIFGAVVGKTVNFNGNNGFIHYDAALATYANSQIVCNAIEVSRSSPVIATVSNQSALVQGTFTTPTASLATITNIASVPLFTFPYFQGHMRARVASTVGTTSTAFSSGTILFDAAAPGKIPTPVNAGCTAKNGTCRNVFTNTAAPAADGTSFHPTMVQLNDPNASAIGSLIAPATVVQGITPAHWKTIVQKVVASKLGGVDRSTPAVIGPSPTAGVGTRPTIAYFGASDGMIHAVCASTGGTTPSQSNICPSLGTELWAFLPRTQLPLIRTNTARIDGSPSVSDVFGDFTNNPATGTKSFRTILTFQTGFSTGSKPAAYAIDITDPASPVLLWEYTTPTQPAALDFGTGLTVATGAVRSANKLTNIAAFQTTNGGSNAVGVVTTALAHETGTKLWQFTYAYPTPPRGVAADLPLPSTGIPGGAVAVDLANQGTVTDIVFGDLFGNLWRLNAQDGTSRNGANTPLFSFTTNKHPIGARPAIFSDGSQQFAAFASGGYVDPSTTSWSTSTQFVIGVKLSSTAPTPVSEATAACATCAVAFKQTLSGANGFSQVLVVGTKLFLTTDQADLNLSTYGGTSNTGRVMTVDLTTMVATTSTLNSGGSSLVSSGSTLYSSSSNGQQTLATTATPGGSSVNAVAVAKMIRRLWLRSE